MTLAWSGFCWYCGHFTWLPWCCCPCLWFGESRTNKSKCSSCFWCLVLKLRVTSRYILFLSGATTLCASNKLICNWFKRFIICVDMVYWFEDVINDHSSCVTEIKMPFSRSYVGVMFDRSATEYSRSQFEQSPVPQASGKFTLCTQAQRRIPSPNIRIFWLLLTDYRNQTVNSAL